MQCNILAAIGPGRLLCQAGMRRRGRSTAFVEARLCNGAGALAATASAVAAIQPPAMDAGAGPPDAAQTEAPAIRRPPFCRHGASRLWTANSISTMNRNVSGRTPPAGSFAPDAQVAQLVEQRTENPRVGGSNPPLGTTFLSINSND